MTASPPGVEGAIGTGRLVVFRLDGQRYALPLAAVGRVVRAVEVTPLPRAPHPVSGAVDIGGAVVPVFSLRRRLGLADRPVAVADHMVIARTARRTVALLVEAVDGVIDGTGRGIVPAAAVHPGLSHIEGIARDEDGMVLIHDLGKFLSLDEDAELEAALAARPGGHP